MDKRELNQQLFDAVVYGAPPERVRALVKNGADVNDKGGPPLLHLAIQAQQSATARILIEEGADVDARDLFQNTALHAAVQNNDADTARLLIEHGADIEAKNDRGNTPDDVARMFAYTGLTGMLEDAAKQRSHTSRVTGERKDKSPPQVGG